MKMGRRHEDGSTSVWVVVAVLLAVWACESASADDDHPIPDFSTTLQGSYSLTVEMTSVMDTTTYYVEEVHERRLFHDELSNMQGVKVRQNGSYITYHYFPITDIFVQEDETQCQNSGALTGDHFWGWYDIDPQHGEKSYGPSSILRLSTLVPTIFFSADVNVDGVVTERWQASFDSDNINVTYSFTQYPWIAPDAQWFSEGNGRVPVEFEVQDRSATYRYSIVKFLPFVDAHHILEPSRGKACEALVGVEMGSSPPNIPWHFSMAEEVIIGPEISGISIGGQHVDKLQLTYAGHLSLVSLLFTMPVMPGDTSAFAYKVIHDFNTGVQYSMSTEYGNCTLDFIPPNGFDTHFGGFLGTGGTLLGPNQLFHLDTNYAFVGEHGSRSLKGDLWTSTRINDIPDPFEHDLQTLPKAVLEYYFSQGMELTPSGDHVPANLPFRGDLYMYNNSDPSQVIEMTTLNFYDFRVINLVSEGEFSVEECYEKHSDKWSYLDIFFPAEHDDQMTVASTRQDEFKDGLIETLVEVGHISPVRIASIDITVGLQGVLPNTTNSYMVTAKVKLLDRAPYIYSYRHPTDEPLEQPGDKEKKYDDIRHIDTCAELCSLEEDFDCMSFHHCTNGNCFLSKLETADGDAIVQPAECYHWVSNVDNQTFPDYPTSMVYKEVLDAIVHGTFLFGVQYQNHTVGFEASASIIYRTPDPLDIIKMQFTYEGHSMTLVNPDNNITVPTKDECLLLCVTWREYRCETAVHQPDDNICLLSATHFHYLNATDVKPHSHSYVYSRIYLSDYSPVLGGVALNTTGPIYSNVTYLEKCARYCSTETSIKCQSFEWCFSDFICHLHTELYLDVVDGGNYLTGTSCIHYSKKTDQIFSRYPNQALDMSQHYLVATNTTAEACAKLCVDDMEEVCQSYDFCTSCVEDDFNVCGEQNAAKIAGLCFLAAHHMGESDLMLMPAKTCDHFSRTQFGDMDYGSWVASQRQADKPYTSGDMTGLAFGMIFLGILLAIGFLAAMTAFKPNAVPKDFNLMFISSTGESDI